MGRPALFEEGYIRKEVWLHPHQAAYWDHTTPKRIRDLLEGVNILKVYETLFEKIFNNREVYLFIAQNHPDIIEYIKKHEEL
jgi:hypothetical protein